MFHLPCLTRAQWLVNESVLTRQMRGACEATGHTAPVLGQWIIQVQYRVEIGQSEPGDNRYEQSSLIQLE